MTTAYYISWQVKKSNRVRAWYASKEVDTEDEARAMYEKKMNDTKVITMYLWKKDTYKPAELKNWPHSYDANDFRALKTYTRI